MKSSTEALFKEHYQSHLKHLKLKGLQPKTIEAYSRAIRRVGERFDHQIDSLSEVRSGPGFGMVQAARADPVHVLRGGDGDRENADCVAVLRGHAGAYCHSGDAVTM